MLAGAERLSKESPSFWAAVATIPVGLGICALGIYWLLASDVPGTLAVCSIIIGVVDVLTAFLVLRRLRIAWSFAVSLNATLAISTLFGAPRIRDELQALELPGALALIPCLIFGATALLHIIADEH